MRTSEPNLRRKWLMTSVAMQDTMAFDKGRTRSRVKRVVCVDVHQLRALAIWHCLRTVSVVDLSLRVPPALNLTPPPLLRSLASHLHLRSNSTAPTTLHPTASRN